MIEAVPKELADQRVRIGQLLAELNSERERADNMQIRLNRTRRELVLEMEHLDEALSALRTAREALVEARKMAVEQCEQMGFSKAELPSFAFEYIDKALSKIDKALGDAA